MKKYIFLLVGLLFLFNCAGYQRIPPEEAQLQKIYELQGMTKDVIFDKTIAWMAETFVSSKNVIELKDKENGKIIGKGVMRKTQMVGHSCTFTMIIDIKHSRIRITLKNLRAMLGEDLRTTRPMQYRYEMDPMKPKLAELCDNLYHYLKNQKADW